MNNSSSFFGKTQTSDGGIFLARAKPLTITKPPTAAFWATTKPLAAAFFLLGNNQTSGGGLFPLGNNNQTSGDSGLFGNTQASGGSDLFRLLGNNQNPGGSPFPPVGTNQRFGGAIFADSGNNRTTGGGGLYGRTQASGGSDLSARLEKIKASENSQKGLEGNLNFIPMSYPHKIRCLNGAILISSRLIQVIYLVYAIHIAVLMGDYLIVLVNCREYGGFQKCISRGCDWGWSPFGCWSEGQ